MNDYETPSIWRGYPRRRWWEGRTVQYSGGVVDLNTYAVLVSVYELPTFAFRRGLDKGLIVIRPFGAPHA